MLGSGTLVPPLVLVMPLVVEPPEVDVPPPLVVVPPLVVDVEEVELLDPPWPQPRK